MFQYFILGVALLAGLLFAGRWFATADPKSLAVWLKRIIVGLALAVAVFLVVTGRLSWALFTLPILLPWIMRFRALARMSKNFNRMRQSMGGGASGGQTSDVETRFLKLYLDHGTGEMGGEILEGEFAGRAIDSLSLSELLSLLGACATEDPQSAQVLEAYLNRVHPDWQEHVAAAGGGHQGGSGAAASGPMDAQEAYRILGLEAGAGKDEIKEAHRRLMANLHPDRGGSTYLAAKINEAKDMLLRRNGR